MDFGSVIGQNEIIENLIYALESGRVGHAYLFIGPAGIGKSMVANIFSGLLLCENPLHGSSCGKCQACLLFESGSNPDFHRKMPEGVSIGVDEIRDIQSDVAIKPMYSKRKVYIIEEADKMTVQAQNCLLKTLEEPPPYVVIILTAANYEALLETIRSRSQRLSFKKNTIGQIRQAVINMHGCNAEGMDFAAAYADGAIGTALELVGTGGLLPLREKIYTTLSHIRKARLFEIFDVFGFFEEQRENIDVVLDIMVLYYRDMLVARETGNENMLINSDKKDIIFNNAPAYPLLKLVKSIEQIEEARRAIRQNANYQLVIENMLIKLQEE